tara:strand:+ start:298 stop:1167 length:870 start_codon:yes stop_codon:yes gene_type:complete
MYFILKLLSRFFQILPRTIALFLGRLIGKLIYYIWPIRKSIALKNISLAFPNYNLKQKKQLLKSCYIHYGMVLVDFFCLPNYKYGKNNSILNLSKESLNLLNSYSKGIIFSAHIGNWEYIGPALGVNSIKCAGVAGIQKNSQSDKFFNELRSSDNVFIVPANSGSEIMTQLIIDGYYIGLISDQNAGSRGTNAKFFNYDVSVPKGAGAFHLKTNTPILLGFCILCDDYKYKLSFYEMDLTNLSKDSEQAIADLNQRFTNFLEDLVKKYPEQYFWFHRKWNKSVYKNLKK